MPLSPQNQPPNGSAPDPASSGGGDAPSRFLPVHLESINPHVLEMDLWIRYPDQPRPALYRSVGVECSAEDLKRLKEAGIEFLYIPAAQHARYRKLLLRQLDSDFHNGTGTASDRAKVIRKTLARMIEEVLVLPGASETVQTVAEASKL